MTVIYELAVFFPCLVSLFWVVALFPGMKRNIRPQKIWTLCLAVLCVCSFIWGILFTRIEDYTLYYKLDIVDLVLTLLFLPLVFIYFWSLNHSGKITWRQYLWLLPGPVLGCICVVFCVLMGEEKSVECLVEILRMEETIPFERGSIQWIYCVVNLWGYVAVLLVEAVVMLVYAISNLIRYRKGLSNFFSNLDNKYLENNQAVLAGLFCLLLIALGATLAGSFSFHEYYLPFVNVLFVALSACIYYMSYHVSKIRIPIGGLVPEEPGEAGIAEMPEASGGVLYESPDEAHIKIMPQFIKLIDEDKLFLHPDITLDDIARRINSNRTYISRIINEEFGCNFYDFINTKRITYAAEIIAQNPLFTQEQIAHESGFLHVATFSRVLKRLTGRTFREWQRDCIKNLSRGGNP